MARKLLVVKGPTFYAEGDESAFFRWLQDISCVAEVTGHLRDLHIVLKRKPTRNQFRELDALFRRYRISRRTLATWEPKA